MKGITITVTRPKHGVCIFTHDQKTRIYPDNEETEDTVFPGECITVISKPQGHVVVAYKHMERWLLAGFSCEKVDLGRFSDHWDGCNMTLLKTEDI